MQDFKRAVIRAIEIINGLGFALIVGAVVYFILGEVTSLVGGHMLDWTFCGSVHYVTGAEWCGVEPHTGEVGVDHFFRHLMSVTTLPWFMMFWGLVLTGLSALGLKLLGYRYRPPGSTTG